MAQGRKSLAEADPKQLLIDWKPVAAGGNPPTAPPVHCGASPPESAVVEPLVQTLPWDFKTTFPQPTDAAIDSGVIDESDRKPENLKSLHDNYARECLATLAAIDKVMDARRKGVDPGTGNKPRTHVSRERLRKYLTDEPARLEHTFGVLIDTYAEAFGRQAADAFRKAIRAWHAGIEVKVESWQSVAKDSPHVRKAHSSSCLPVPKPLRSSVSAGVFGQDEQGKPVRPCAQEVRAITEGAAERMIEMTDDELQVAAKRYAEDFGPKASAQLERYVRRQKHSR